MKDFGYANLFDKPPAVNKRGPASPLDAPRLCTLCRQTRPPDQFYKGKSNRWVCAPCKRHLARESDKKAAYADLKSGRVKPAERLYPNRPVSPPSRLRCTACDKVKPLAGFKINADGWPVGRRCRECVRYTASPNISPNN